MVDIYIIYIYIYIYVLLLFNVVFVNPFFEGTPDPCRLAASLTPSREGCAASLWRRRATTRRLMRAARLQGLY